jgi:hypothetical protein
MGITSVLKIHCDKMAINDISFLQNAMIEFFMKETYLAAGICGHLHCVCGYAINVRWRVKYFKDGKMDH